MNDLALASYHRTTVDWAVSYRMLGVRIEHRNFDFAVCFGFDMLMANNFGADNPRPSNGWLMWMVLSVWGRAGVGVEKHIWCGMRLVFGVVSFGFCGWASSEMYKKQSKKHQLVCWLWYIWVVGVSRYERWTNKMRFCQMGTRNWSEYSKMYGINWYLVE